jgi:hypothetical protein
MENPLYSVGDRVTSEWCWWWIDEDKYPCLKRNSNPRSFSVQAIKAARLLGPAILSICNKDSTFNTQHRKDYRILCWMTNFSCPHHRSAVFRRGSHCLLSSVYSNWRGRNEESVTNQPATPKHSLSHYVIMLPCIASGTSIMNGQYITAHVQIRASMFELLCT